MVGVGKCVCGCGCGVVWMCGLWSVVGGVGEGWVWLCLCAARVCMCMWVLLWVVSIEADAQCFHHVDATFLVGLRLIVGLDPTGVWLCAFWWWGSGHGNGSPEFIVVFPPSLRRCLQHELVLDGELVYNVFCWGR